MIYLKVKLRKERTLARTEYTDVRDRIEDVRIARARRRQPRHRQPLRRPLLRLRREPPTRLLDVGSGAPRPRRTTTTASSVEIPAGTEIDVRLRRSLNSGTAQVEDRFEATTLVDRDRRRRTLVIPAGSVIRGVVTAVEPADRARIARPR